MRRSRGKQTSTRDGTHAATREQQFFLVAGGVILMLIVVVVGFNMIWGPGRSRNDSVRVADRTVVSPERLGIAELSGVDGPRVARVTPAPAFTHSVGEKAIRTAPDAKADAPADSEGWIEVSTPTATRRTPGVDSEQTAPEKSPNPETVAERYPPLQTEPSATPPVPKPRPVPGSARRARPTTTVSSSPASSSASLSRDRIRRQSITSTRRPDSVADMVAVEPSSSSRQPSAAVPPPKQERKSSSRGGYSVQLGSFSNTQNARNVQQRMETMDFEGVSLPAYVLPVEVNGKSYYRVRVGPFSSHARADRAMAFVNRVSGLKGRIMPPGK
ncbi:MAG: SPOR domain-containing protein [Magnetococcales bacterium]|nr:SPOR domain-containing protein [Magnetococcales bacterium]